MKETTVTLMDDSTQLVKEITFGDWKQTRTESSEFDNDVALVRACTGLDFKTIEEMDAPDFTDLLIASLDINNSTSKPNPGASIVELKEPAINVMGESIKTIKIAMPKVKAARELDKLTDPNARVEYMIKATTQLVDLDSIPMGDYSMLVSAVPDFFGQGAAFFRANRSKN